MSDLSFKAVLLGEDRSLSKALKDGGEEADRTSGKLQAMGKVAAIGLGGLALGVAAIFKTGIDEQSDFLKGQAQLTAGVKSTGGAANVTVNHMEDLASSIQNYSGQTDDSIVASEQLLLTFTGIKNQAGPMNDIFDQTVKVSADMAAKMGGTASDSAIQLGKALNDPTKGITALTRVGVSFTDGQKKQIAALQNSGDMLGAQKIILKELNTEFGGSAKAAGDTLPGQLARAKRSFEDVSQSVVAALMPVLVKLGDVLVKYVVPAFNTAVQWIIKNWPAIQKVIVATWQNYIMPALMAVVGVFRKYVIPAIAAAIDYVVQHWPQIKAAFVTAWEAIKPTLDAFVGLLKQLWESVLQPLWAWVQDHWPQIRAVMEGVFIAVAIAAKILLIALQIIFDAIGIAIQIVAATISWLYTNIWAPTINLMIGVVKGLWTAAVDTKDGIVTAFDAVVGFVTGLPGRIASATSGMWDGIKNAFKAAINWIIDGWNGLQFSIPGVDTHIPGVGTVGGFTLGTPDIPRLALGGIVTRPTMAMIGEAGPEAVIPLNRRNTGQFGGSTTINVYPRSDKPRDIANAVIDAVRKEGMTLPIASGIR